MRRIHRALCALTVCVISGCANNDIYLRPERTTFLPLRSYFEKDSAAKLNLEGKEMKVNCLDWRGNIATKPVVDPRPTAGSTQCLYTSVDLEEVLKAFHDTTTPPLKERRNIYYSFLRKVGDDNCDTFLGRSFANKASLDTAKNTFQDVLTGLSAGVATAAPPTSAGLGLINLVGGKAVDNINSTFYYEKTFQAMASAIDAARKEIKKDMDDRKNDDYYDYTIFDLLTDLRRYDAACSVRVGVAKLQALTQETSKARESQASQEQASKTIASQKQQIATQQKLIEQQKTTLGELEGQLKKLQDGFKEASVTESRQ